MTAMHAAAKKMLLKDLLPDAKCPAELEVTGLSSDSRSMEAGHLFAALPGGTSHGAQFFREAVAAGATAAITDEEGAKIAATDPNGAGIPVVVCKDPRSDLACAAARWFGGHPDTVVAVTGTNGKTSIVSMTRQIWEFLGREAASVGTLGVEGAYRESLRHTTPDPVTLHRILGNLRRREVDCAALEASSHGILQRRIDGVRLKAAAFTNLSHDHLDYHVDFEEYFNAKARLFECVLRSDSTAVVCNSQSYGRRISAIAKARGIEVIEVGERAGSTLRIVARRYGETGQELHFEWKGNRKKARLNLVGRFQGSNALTAAGLAIASGDNPEDVFRSLENLGTVRGRMELAARVENGSPIYIDYAHTPAALAAALESLRPHTVGRLCVVFGAGGDRDKSKRRFMGEAAARYADSVFITDDNPRNESPASIRSQILLGCPGAREIEDRAAAIFEAVSSLGPGDGLLIAGKGHETGQIVGETVYPFNDGEQASISARLCDGKGT